MASLLPGVRRAWLVAVLSVLLAGDAIRFTAGWVTFGVIAALVGIVAMLFLVAHRDRWRVRDLPYPLLGFLSLATASLAWSAYPAATALGLLTTWLIAIAAIAIVVTTGWEKLLKTLGIVVGLVLALSIAFELFVATVIRAPILPLFTQPGVDYSQYEKIPDMLYWSRNELFQVLDDGRIQGIVGNANNLGFLALLGMIVFSLMLADGSIRRSYGFSGLVLSVSTIFMTRSATVTVALVGVAAVAAAVIALRRFSSPRARARTWAAILAVVVAGAVAVTLLRGTLLAIVGKSADLTGRLGIWDAVIALAQQRPAFGWGWVSFWMPWTPPFTDLAFRNGVRQLQAHNAWIDLWFQLGIVGLIVFAALILGALTRSWSLAVDQPQHRAGHVDRYRALTLFPLLTLGALVIQSFAESRLLVEYGWAFVVVFAAGTRFHEQNLADR